MAAIEKPDAFYLGKQYDLESKTLRDEPVQYDAHESWRSLGLVVEEAETVG